MRNLPIAKLCPGMVTAEDVYAEGSSRLLLPKGLVLTDRSITRLELYSIFSVKVESSEDTSNPPIPDDIPLSERVRTSPEFRNFSRKYDQDISLLETSLNDIVRQNTPLNTGALMADLIGLLNTSDGRVNIFDMLTNLRSYDDLTYAHAINVALICHIFAQWLHYSPEEVELATLCGLLHDIGKLMIPEEILKKPAALSDEEYEIIKTHTVKGYQKLRQCNADLRICNAALMHHERYDGSGYPLGLQREQISPLASLVSLADVYDAMTSARVYRGPLCSFYVISLIEAEGYQKYAPGYLLTFLENIVNTYLLHTVRLSNGEEGKIVYINRQQISAPTVKVADRYIDLAAQPDLSIVSIL